MNTEEPFLTILTPAFNRAAKLPSLYASLCSQTDKGFIWLVVDDGSTDGTKDLIRGFAQEEKEFAIIYIRKENGGKHTALNLGIRQVRTELTFIVDSDDRLIPGSAVAAIRRISREYAPRRQSEHLCGFSLLRVDEQGAVNAGSFPVDGAVSTYMEQRINAGLLGDKAEVFYTDVLRQYPFPVFAGEKFLPEDAVWMAMSPPWNMVHLNRPVYICEYLEGGLTKSGRRMKIHSPLGMMYRSKVYLEKDGVKTSVRLKMMLLYQIYRGFAGELYRNGEDEEERRQDGRISAGREDHAMPAERALQCVSIRHGFMYWLMWAPGCILHAVWKRRYA